MKIINAKVYTEEGTFTEKEIWIENNRFADSDCSAETVIDAKGCYAIPGLVDIHFHGCMNHDFCDGTTEAIKAMAMYEASVGVTAIAPATMTLPEEQLLTICRAAKEYREHPDTKGADLCGINMEGPFIVAGKKGAQNGAYIRKADAGMFDR